MFAIKKDSILNNLTVLNLQKMPIYNDILVDLGTDVGQEGCIAYQSNSGTFYGHNGTTWAPLGSGSDSIWTLVSDSEPGFHNFVQNVSSPNVNYTTNNLIFGSASLSGSDAKLVFKGNNGYFRAGTINNTQWDPINCGAGSVAFNSNNTAKGNDSSVFGTENTVQGQSSTVTGGNSNSIQALVSNSIINSGQNNNIYGTLVVSNQVSNNIIASGVGNTIALGYITAPIPTPPNPPLFYPTVLNCGIFVGLNNILSDKADVSASAILSGTNNKIGNNTSVDNSIVTTGINNSINNSSKCVIASGRDNVIGSTGTCSNSSILSGESNHLGDTSNSDNSTIVSGLTNGINGSQRSAVLCGDTNNINNSSNSAIISGNAHNINTTSANCTILSGINNAITSCINSTILAGNAITLTGNNTAGTQNLRTFNSVQHKTRIISGTSPVNLEAPSSVNGGDHIVILTSNNGQVVLPTIAASFDIGQELYISISGLPGITISIITPSGPSTTINDFTGTVPVIVLTSTTGNYVSVHLIATGIREWYVIGKTLF